MPNFISMDEGNVSIPEGTAVASQLEVKITIFQASREFVLAKIRATTQYCASDVQKSPSS